MAAVGEWRCPITALGAGHSARFSLACGDRVVDGFVVNYRGHYAAYVNRCAHVGTPLDLWPNEFFTEDGHALICATHGALYDPLSGLCTAGPCAGDGLTPLSLAREGDEVVVRCATAPRAAEATAPAVPDRSRGGTS